MRYVFAGDRDIAVDILDYLLQQGHFPMALWVSDPGRASHATDLKRLVAHLDIPVFVGKEFESEVAIESMMGMELDYIIGIHFPYIIRKVVLDLPNIGVLNLHPAYLPYNRGWHTPSWAIAEGTPVGATLHFMSETLDMGDIIGREEVKVENTHTANELYIEMKRCEYHLFVSSLPAIVSLNPPRIPQSPDEGTAHVRSDLFKYQERNLSEAFDQSDRWIDILRAFTTNDVHEAAFFERNNEKFAVQVKITKLDE